MIEASDVIGFLERDGPFIAVLAVAAWLGLLSLGRLYRSYRDSGRERMGLYIVIVLQTWMFLLIFLAYTYWARVVVAGQPWSATLSEIGLTAPISPNDLMFWSGALLISWYGLVWLFTALQKSLGLSPTQARLFLQPRTVSETAVFSLVVAPTAGFCEEVFFRGYLVSFLMRTQEEWLAIVVAASLFGIAHLAQGVTGMVASGLMAASAAWMFVVTGSIWPAIAAHTLYNMSAPFLFDVRGQEDQTSA